jgi:hypothetical protein
MASPLSPPVRLVGLAAAVGALLVAAPSRVEAAPQPAVSVSPSAVDAGGTLHVTGSGFPARSIVTAQICGRNATDGSSDCDLENSQTVAGTMDGAFVADLPVSLPPVPCPCVVWVNSASSSLHAEHPIVINGAPGPQSGSVAATTPSVGTIKIERVSIGNGSWKSWFGISDPRPVTVTVRNIGSAPYDQLRLVITAGRGKNPSGFVPLPPVQRLNPGHQATTHALVSLGPAAVGNYTVKVRVGSGSEGTATRARATVWPWGLLVIAVILVQVCLLGFRNVARRRLARREAAHAQLAEVAAINHAELVQPTVEHSSPDGEGEPPVISWSAAADPDGRSLVAPDR